MTTLFYLRQIVLPAAYQLLPAAMNTPPATALLLAIALQESELAGVMRRRQLGGPARGFWQFEQGGGVHGVLTHPASAPIIYSVLTTLRYKPLAAPCYDAIEHHDILAACFARCLLWTLPDVLPGPHQPQDGWAQYLRAWRPGKPHRERWDAAFDRAWALLTLHVDKE